MINSTYVAGENLQSVPPFTIRACHVSSNEAFRMKCISCLTLGFDLVRSQAGEAEAAARLLAHQPLLHLHPGHRARQRLQQRTLPGQRHASQVRQRQLQPKLCPEQHVSPALSH